MWWFYKTILTNNGDRNTFTIIKISGSLNKKIQFYGTTPLPGTPGLHGLYQHEPDISPNVFSHRKKQDESSG